MWAWIEIKLSSVLKSLTFPRPNLFKYYKTITYNNQTVKAISVFKWKLIKIANNLLSPPSVAQTIIDLLPTYTFPEVRTIDTTFECLQLKKLVEYKNSSVFQCIPDEREREQVLPAKININFNVESRKEK